MYTHRPNTLAFKITYFDQCRIWWWIKRKKLKQ